jgi:hypothetical protein
MLYLPNNRLKLETSTPKRVLPGATYNSDVQSAPPDTNSLQWKQQCWWLSRTSSIIDAKFCGASELLSDEVAQDSQGTNIRWCFPTGFEPVIYSEGGSTNINPIINTLDEDNQIIVQSNPFNLIGKPCPLVKNTIYTNGGICYTRYYLVVGIYTFPFSGEQNEYSVFQVEIAGNTAFDYFISRNGDDFSFSNTRYRDAHDNVIQWPSGATLFYDENSARTRTEQNLTIDDLYKQTGGIDTTGYAKSVECKVVPGRAFYLCLLFDSIPDNASEASARINYGKDNSAYFKSIISDTDLNYYSTAKITNNGSDYLYGSYVSEKTNSSEGIPGAEYNQYLKFSYSVRVREIDKSNTLSNGYVFRNEELKEILLDPLCFRTVRVSQTINNEVKDYKTSIYRITNSEYETTNHKFCLSSNFTIGNNPSDSVLWGKQCTLNYALSEYDTFAKYINVEYTTDEDMNYHNFGAMTALPIPNDYKIDTLSGFAPDNS